MRAGFIGLGNIGAPLALNLVAGGHEVGVFDVDPTAVAKLAREGAWAAGSVRELASRVEVLITCLPSPAVVRSVLEGETGALAAMTAGNCWVEMSTNDPEVVLELAARAASFGIDTLEAPVTGGCHRARSGNISILIGGEAAVFERHRPVLESMGGRVLHVGELGKASHLKVITNMLAFIHLVAAGEALMLAAKGGIDLATAFEGIRISSGNSFVHETESQLVLSGSYQVGFTFDLALKDMGFATGFGRRLDVPLEVAGLVEQVLVRGRAAFGGDAQSTQVVKLLEDICGLPLRAAGFPELLEE